MKGLRAFDLNTIKCIRRLIRKLRNSERNEQKAIRAELREKYQFFISDFTNSTKGFTVLDFDVLVRSGQIRSF